MLSDYFFLYLTSYILLFNISLWSHWDAPDLQLRLIKIMTLKSGLYSSFEVLILCKIRSSHSDSPPVGLEPMTSVSETSALITHAPS